MGIPDHLSGVEIHREGACVLRQRMTGHACLVTAANPVDGVARWEIGRPLLVSRSRRRSRQPVPMRPSEVKCAPRGRPSRFLLDPER